ncbi:hypothetical protein BJX70DRAFT_330878 [Aspergillus crustosus]
MPRRAHRKSRNGCLECKRRHVKCDERRPICSNCTASERDCQYGTRFLHVYSGPPLGGSSAPTTPSDAPSPEARAPTPPAYDDQPVNMLHAELLHNLYTNTYTTFHPTRTIPWLSETVSHSITNPYLVNEMLAFSALHLSTLRPHKRDFYHYHAAQLQTHALTIFKQTNPEVSQDTCVPLFLFTSTLGIHMLCDTLIYREPDFTHFLLRFVHYLRLQHGVRTVVAEAWSLLHDSPAKEAFDDGIVLYKFNGRLGPECGKLLALIQAANLGTDLTKTYRDAIETLQACTNVTHSGDETDSKINGLLAWPVIVSLEFSDHLEMRRPEALVLLAHYAVLLHQQRDSWLFGDSGRFVIESVTRYLGEEWEEWLRWPNQALLS